MDIRPYIQETCDKLHENNEKFKHLHVTSALNQGNLNQAETHALIEAIQANTHVTEMFFYNCHLSGPENSMFVNFVVETLIPSHPSLKSLIVAGNMLTDEAAERIAIALKGNTSLDLFFLINNRLGTNGVQALAEAIRHNKGLTAFGLKNNVIGLDSFRTILSSISAKPNFKLFEHLEMSGNNIGIEGSKVIADFILEAKSLVTIVLECNRVGDEGCQIIANTLPNHPSLKQIYLSGNNITDRGCISMSRAIRYSALQMLGFKDNSITWAGAAAVCATLQHVNYSVQSVDLSGNAGVSDEQRDQITRLCNANRQIKLFHDSAMRNVSMIPRDLWPMVLEAVETKPGLLFALIKEKPDLIPTQNDHVVHYGDGCFCCTIL